MTGMAAKTSLDLFLPPVRRWFETTLGSPTPVQAQGWPVIAADRSALLLAPTGSGKTLASFLACLDHLWRQDPLPRGIQILYISPLKALNNDIYRNLQVPLAGVAEQAPELPTIEIAVRTGDTPGAERQRLVRHPPHVLITTPESLHLLLTSKARDVLRNVRYCIIDEIHALCPNKRGVFLALLLERLQQLNERDIVRIGLSATQRPLDEVARYLGGFAYGPDGLWKQRPVAIVDAGLRKNLDLAVVSPVEHFGPLPEKTIWPSIYRRLANEIRSHRSTIVFANNRRSVERLTSQLNDYLQEDEGEQDNPWGTIGSCHLDLGASARSDRAPQKIQVRAHHGSVALEVRQQTEQALKEGRLRAVVATASLELGIDMGTVDLVCQVESPGNVARALQRVGRAGHLVGQSSKGRLLPKTLPDLLNQAVLAKEMTAGQVEALHVPMNCLDVLAQQVIAMVAMDEWGVSDLYQLVRRAYPYCDLTPGAFDVVLEMVTGRYRFDASDLAPGQKLTALQPRISWDRVHQRLHALPGSQRLAIVHGGTIPDTGQYAVYTEKGLRLGEVDEEFVYERRVGDTFLLGTNAWRIDRIETDRVLVHPAKGMPAMAPFWRGESTGRTYDLGLAQGKFLHELGERLDRPDCLDWLQRDYHLDRAAASNLRDFVRRQQARDGRLPSDRTLIIEASRDPLGDWQVVLLCPLGRAVNFSLRMAIEHRLRHRLGYRQQCLHHDDGILIRLTESDEPMLDLFADMTSANVRDMILDELADSALFALRFRQNAARALMMPRGGAGKRAPLWLQRLRGRDLLQVARRHADFPIVAETFRECLHDHLDLPHVQELLDGIANGSVAVHARRAELPSPFVAGLLFAFTAVFMYQYDGVESSGERTNVPLDQTLLDQLIGASPVPLDPRAIEQVDRRLRGAAQLPRTKAEAAEWLRRLGDIAPGDVPEPQAEFLRELESDGVVVQLRLENVATPVRWILAEEADRYRRAFAAADASAAQEAATIILRRFLETHALVGLDDVLGRYPFERTWTQQQLDAWTNSGRLVRVATSDAEPLQWSAPESYEQMQRGTLSILRHEIVPCPAPQFVDFLLRWQHMHPATQQPDFAHLPDVLNRLEACLMPADLLEQPFLSMRLRGYQPKHLDAIANGGAWTWFARQDADQQRVAFVRRESLAALPPPQIDGELDESAARVAEVLRGRGALFSTDIVSETRLVIAAVQSALWKLLRLGLATNDQFDVVRRGEPPRLDEVPTMRSRGEVRAFLRDARRRRETSWPEGRWSLLTWGQPDPETAAFTQARLLIERYGILSRELAILGGAPTPWRVLYEILSRMELSGDVRRGYFVEGLSGAQFALPEAAKLLSEIGLPSAANAPVVLVHSLDPANPYGSGAALDLPVPFLRRHGNWLVVKAGHPLLLVENQGKRLFPLTSNEGDLALAVAQLPAIAKLTAAGDVRHRLIVESWNGEPVTSTIGKDLLAQAGFARDYQAMTLYAVWQT